jgi:hypothetical protein
LTTVHNTEVAENTEFREKNNKKDLELRNGKPSEEKQK